MDDHHDPMALERALQWASIATILGLGLVVPSALSMDAGWTPTIAIIVLVIAALLTSWSYYRVRTERYDREGRSGAPDDRL